MSADDAGGGAWGRRRRSGPAASPHGVCSAAMLEVGAPWHLIVALATLGGPAAFDDIRYHEGGCRPRHVSAALRALAASSTAEPGATDGIRNGGGRDAAIAAAAAGEAGEGAHWFAPADVTREVVWARRAGRQRSSPSRSAPTSSSDMFGAVHSACSACTKSKLAV